MAPPSPEDQCRTTRSKAEANRGCYYHPGTYTEFSGTGERNLAREGVPPPASELLVLNAFIEAARVNPIQQSGVALEYG